MSNYYVKLDGLEISYCVLSFIFVDLAFHHQGRLSEFFNSRDLHIIGIC